MIFILESRRLYAIDILFEDVIALLALLLFSIHFEHFRFNAGRFWEFGPHSAKQSSSVISAHNDCRWLSIANGSLYASLLDF